MKIPDKLFEIIDRITESDLDEAISKAIKIAEGDPELSKQIGIGILSQSAFNGYEDLIKSYYVEEII
jgi:hypothetical protein